MGHTKDVLLIAYAALLLGPPAKPNLVPAYLQLEKLTRDNNGKAMAQWYETHAAPSFFYKSRDGVQFKRDAFIQGVREQAQAVEKVISYQITVKPMKGTDRSALLYQVESVFEGRTKFDTVLMRLTDTSTATDTWRVVGGKWRLVSSVQSKAETQMQPVQ